MLATATQQIDGLWGPSFSFVTGLLFLALFLAAVLIFLVRRRYRAQRRDILRQIRELEALSEAGRALVEAELDIADLCELIATQAGQFTDTDTFQIGLFHEDEYHIVFWKVEGERRPAQLFELVEDGGLVGWVRRQRQPLLIHDFDRERDRLPAQPNFVSGRPLRSGIFIPLLSGEETLGVLVAQSQEPDHFTDDDLR
ncbi:MAG: GAF domain-containing protein, partial [Candidatus Promineifilaceae bacterium]|nr:GAF domain-containing protein [Candidatus Promineifilaceae bacterium]